MIDIVSSFSRGLAKRVGMDGATAVADVAYRMSEMSFLFPITPATPSGEAVERFAAEGKKNFAGNVLDITQMQSEAGAAGAFHGAAGLGVLTTTFTASQGLLLMLPDIYRMAGDHYPGVFHIAARSVGTMGISIYGDHSDIMCVKSSGAAMLSSTSPQECADLAAISHASSLKASYPFIHFYDGFRTSHEINTIDYIPDSTIKELIDEEALQKFKLNALTPNRPSQRGAIYSPELFWQFWERGNIDLQKIAPTIVGTMEKFGKLTGRKYEPYRYFGPHDATDVIVCMGSVSKIFEEYIKHQGFGLKVGVLNIHMFRPFLVDSFIEKIPRTVKRICVMDRTRDVLSSSEPLHLEIQSIVKSNRPSISIIGGKYGISSKDFNPTHAHAVVTNLKSEAPKNRFCVGINDDLTNSSLPIGDTIETVPKDTKQCIFWGFGSDGTVGACKDAIKIIANETPLYGQGYFAYTAHKSGGITTSHLRFGPDPIEAPYLIQEADYVACHKPFFVKKFDIAGSLKQNGTIVFNAPSNQTLESFIPNKMKRQIAQKNAKVYCIDASQLAIDHGLRGRINTIMQTAFFSLSNVLPRQQALDLLKDAARHTYFKKGEEVIQQNIRLIESTDSHLKEYSYDKDSWLNSPDVTEYNPELPEKHKNVLGKMMIQKGDTVSVSETQENGNLPHSATRFEKRGIADFVPVWDSEKCIQCGLCSTVCPHAVIRPFLMTQEEIDKAPIKMEHAKSRIGKAVKDFKFTIQISGYDCTGCGKCAHICPAKALTMMNGPPLFEEKHKKFQHAFSVPNRAHLLQPNNLKNTQFLQPLLEFSGACAGCGETAIIKMITQLYGHKSYMAFATGCPVVWGASAPSNAFTAKPNGKGPAWSSSLYEDNAEFGFGQFKALELRRNTVKSIIEQIHSQDKGENKEMIGNLLNEWNSDKSEELAKTFITKVIDGSVNVTNEQKKVIMNDRDYIAHKMNWIIGGDGWAYDIGYGGLDHILASGEPIKVIILDTEVYSNTGGQPSKASNRSSSNSFSARGVNRAKKDFALLAQTYGNIYVANTCLDADPKHALQTLQEAVSYNGPAVIVNYCPCIEHGFTPGLGSSPTHCKQLMEAGYLVLSRFDPRLEQEGKNPMQIDSPKPNFNIDQVLSSEVRFTNLSQRLPERAKTLREQLVEDCKKRYKKYERIQQSFA